MFLFEITQTTHTPPLQPKHGFISRNSRKSVVVVVAGSGSGAAAVLAFSTFF